MSTPLRRRAEEAIREPGSDSPRLHEIFAAQAAKSPDAIALVCGDRRLSYAELDRRSNQVARRLRELGAGPGQFVGIYFGRSELPIVAILACLKSGAAYVPIDTSHPRGRVEHIVRELRPRLCLTEAALAERARAWFAGTRLLVLDRAWSEIARLPCTALGERESPVSPRDLAYVIYTSGTTGRPKGVMAEHRHVTRFVAAFNEVCATRPEDRVYQGFSLSFDGSVEEIWMALSNGSTLVVPTSDAPRFGNDLARYLTDLGVTYFSTVPTLLATITDAVPTLRTLVLSGEACPAGLVQRWARAGLRILNVYGPTEATVNATVAECAPGRPVTIGRPLCGYGVHVVDGELRPVAAGEVGELLISGDTLARGYVEQPGLTSARFLTWAPPDDGGARRVYRTGDRVRVNEHGELEFFGRIDDQVKIRGYRVEMAEIECVLLEHPHVQAASVRLVERDGFAELAAYVVPKDAPVAPDGQEILALLESRLPPYMIPGYLDAVAELPRTTSGKVDRKRLPAPVHALIRTSAHAAPPETELERAIAEVWAEILGLPSVSADDDFFRDLGGHSLVAAQMVTRLREKTARAVALRDAYEFPTVRRLAAHLDAVPSGVDEPRCPGGRDRRATASRRVFEDTPRLERWATWSLQALSVYVVSGLRVIPAAMLLLLGIGWLRWEIPTARLLGFYALVVLLTSPALLAFSIVAKWILIGRYRPGEHRLWSLYYWRWWLTNRIESLSGASALRGTPLLPLYYRLMGTRVGARCTLDTVHCAIWDLVSIGDDTSIGADTQMLGYRIEDGMLRLGRVDIGSRCFVGIHSALGLDVRMEDGASLDDQSLLPDHAVVPAGEGRRGSPAQRAAVSLPGVGASQTSGRRALFGLAHFAAIEGLALLLFLPPLVFLQALGWLAFTWGGPIVCGVVLIASVPIDLTLYCLYVAALKRTILSRIEPGVYPILGRLYLRKWLADQLMAALRRVLLPVYTTLYFPPLLRLLGAKIGPRAEISTVWSFAPELVDVDAESFFADGSIIGGKRCHRGVFEVRVNRIGRRSFVGNSAVLPVGTSLGDGCLLGVQSIAPFDTPRVPDGTEWLGSPPFALAQRPKVGNFDETLTFTPTRRLYLRRALVDALRILIPTYLFLAATTVWAAALFVVWQSMGTAVMVAVAPIVGFVTGLGAALAVAGLKRAVMGEYKPEIKPLWSMYVWLNEMVNGAYESVTAPAILPLVGTPFIAPFLRAMGCRIGRHTYVGTTLFSEFDLVEVGDYAALNHGVVVQNHLFEDRVFKSSSLKIGDEVSVGNMSVILYDTEIEPRASVGALSLLMKGETLRSGTHWHGIPTVQVRGERATVSGGQGGWDETPKRAESGWDGTPERAAAGGGS